MSTRRRPDRPTPRRKRPPEWWPTRILLAIGIVSVIVIGLGLLASGGRAGGLSDPRPPISLGPLSIPYAVQLSIVVFAFPLVGLIWMIRIFRGAGDEPPPHLDRGVDRHTHGERSEAWWVTRFELAIGIGLVLGCGLLWLATSGPTISGAGNEAVSLGPLMIRSRLLVAIMALVPSIAGLVWMIRIFRGPGDEPPPWRYRSR